MCINAYWKQIIQKLSRLHIHWNIKDTRHFTLSGMEMRVTNLLDKWDITETSLTTALTLSLYQTCIVPSLSPLCQDCDVLGCDEGFGFRDDRVIKGIDCNTGGSIATCAQYTLADSCAHISGDASLPLYFTDIWNHSAKCTKSFQHKSCMRWTAWISTMG